MGGNADEGVFVKLSYSTDQKVGPGQIRIAFINDEFNPDRGIDSKVRIDKFVVDGETT